MAPRKSPASETKSQRLGRKTIARARSGTRTGAIRWVLAAGAAAITLLLILLAIIKSPVSQHGSPDPGPDIKNAPATVAVGNNTSPPWPAPADASAAVNAAGLPMLSHEGNVDHIHAHLDVLVNGQPVTVPAGIGIGSQRGTISPLHTHDTSGVIHIESPIKRQFSLGEFFSEWQVSLNEDNIGALRARDGKTVRVFVNGTRRQGNPAAIMLHTTTRSSCCTPHRDPTRPLRRHTSFATVSNETSPLPCRQECALQIAWSRTLSGENLSPTRTAPAATRTRTLGTQSCAQALLRGHHEPASS
jgi:hypothetical protein